VRIFLFLLFYATVLISKAQEKSGVIFQRFDKSDGLDNNNIGNMAQDQNGFIWIATGNSLQRFDGHYFRSFTTANEPSLFSNDISRVYCDSRNRLWIYYDFRGIGLWDLNTGNKQNFTPDLNNSSSLPEHRVFDIYEDSDGIIWLSIHMEGIARFNEKTEDFQLYNIDRIVPKQEQRDINTVRTMVDHPTNKNELLIGSFNGFLVLNKKSGEVRQLPISKENAESPANINGYENVLLDIYVQNDSTLWLATFGGGILRYDLGSNTFRSIKLDPPFPGNPIKNNFHQFAKRDDNSLWVTLYNKGLYILDLESEQLKMVNEKADGISELSTTLKLLNGKFGHLWLSSNFGLVKIYLEKGFTDYHYLGYPIEDVEIDSLRDLKLVLPNVTDHLRIYDENWELIRKVNYKPIRKFDLNFLEGIHQYQGQFWLIGLEGLYYLNDNLTEIKPAKAFFEQLQEKERLTIISSFIDSGGNLWMGTKVKGIFRYNIPEEKLHHYSPYFNGSQPHTDHWIFNFYEDDTGLIWFGTEAGFCHYNPTNKTFSNFPYPENSKELDDFYFKECIGFSENQNGDIWVASRESGLGLFDSKNFSEPKFLLRSKKNLRNKLLFKVIENEDKLFLHLDQGLSVLNKADYSIENFSKAFGVDQINNVTKRGDLVIGNGFANPSNFDYQKLTPPKIYVDELIIAGENAVFNEKEIRLNFEENSISLRLGIFDLTEEERAQLQYRLNGKKQAQWTPAESGQLLTFPYLEAGNYILKIRAISPSGKLWEIKEIPIVITPLFWQRWWVQALFVLALTTLLSLPVINKIRQKRKRENLELIYEREIDNLKRKALKAQINPHFLFNSLNSIRLLVMKGNIEKATVGISTFAKLVRRILDHSERDEVSLSEELQSVREYIKLEQMRLKEPFDVDIKADTALQLESINIPPMLIQPFLENAIWHGLRHKDGGGKLSINIKDETESGYIVIYIQDNGVGREASARFNSQPQKSYGIKISSERLKNFNSSKIDNIHIHDLKSKNGDVMGTLVEIRLVRS